jgi:hypothetical protein
VGGVEGTFKAYAGEWLVASYQGQLHEMENDIAGDRVHEE